jgi:two-component system chemotaxis sensor kinase CheA
MIDTNDEALQEFIIESQEGLSLVEQRMVALEAAPGDLQMINEIFRAIHTIKGTASFFGLSSIESLSHAGENVLGALRAGRMSLDARSTTALLAMCDLLRQMINNIQATGEEGEVGAASVTEELKDILDPGRPSTNDHAAPRTPAEEPPEESSLPPAREAAPSPPAHEASEASAPEVVASVAPVAGPKAPGPPPSSAAPDVHARPAADAAERSESGEASRIRIDVSLLDKLMDLVGELVLTRNQVLQHTTQSRDGALLRAIQRLNLITSELQEGVTKTRMQPIGNVWQKLPRVVRDLALTCGKKVSVRVEGSETDLDKTVLEAIKDPLIHLVRNSIDHGIEAPEVRTARGKPAEGRLLLRAFHESGRVIIEISDDGGGIDTDKVKRKAVERGLLSQEQANQLSERDALGLIFLPGFSTAEKVTNISGRGVGMDVVKTNIEQIGGTVDVQSTAGQGTVFQIKIPLTLAIIPALIVSVRECRYAIPQVSLVELVRLTGDAAKRGIESFHGVPVYRLRGRLLPILFLDRELNEEAATEPLEDDAVNIVVLKIDGKDFGLVVDRINDTTEIVVKPLSKALKGLTLYAGATIMGDGQVALILDVSYLAKQVQMGSLNSGQNANRHDKDTDPDRRSLLLFSTSDEVRLAIALDAVARLERLPRRLIERSEGQEVIQYRNQIMPLVRITEVLGLPPDEEREELDVLVYARDQQPIGLVVGRILDVVEGDFVLRQRSTRFGFLGAEVIQGRVTDLIDASAVLGSVEAGRAHV